MLQIPDWDCKAICYMINCRIFWHPEKLQQGTKDCPILTFECSTFRSRHDAIRPFVWTHRRQSKDLIGKLLKTYIAGPSVCNIMALCVLFGGVLGQYLRTFAGSR